MIWMGLERLEDSLPTDRRLWNIRCWFPNVI